MAVVVWDRSPSLASSSGLNETNWRNVLYNTYLSDGGITIGKIRIKLAARPSTDYPVDGMSIGERSGSTDDYASTPTRITFNSGSNSTTVVAGVDQWSDWVDYNLDVSKDYLCHIYSDLAGFVSVPKHSETGSDSYQKLNTAVDETLTETVSGYSTETYTYIITVIEGDVVVSDINISVGNASITATGQSSTLEIGINSNNASIILTGYVPILTFDDVILIENASIFLTGKSVVLNENIPVASISLIMTGYNPSTEIVKFIQPNNSTIVVAGQPVVLSETIPIANGSILVEGYGFGVFIWGAVPEFEIAELVPNPEPGIPHDPCGHWHDGQSDNPVWGFTEQADLPIPYHKHPVKPEVCGHWHKQPITIIPCIEFISYSAMPAYPNLVYNYKSGDAMFYHTDGFLYAGAYDSGTMFKINSFDLSIVNQVDFSVSDISRIHQLIYYGGIIYALIERSGYEGKWIQKISLDFELIDPPLYGGSVIVGTDGNIWGARKCLNLTVFISDWTPVTGGSYTTGWEQLPADYSYHIYENISALAAAHAGTCAGAVMVNFRIIPGIGYIINTGPFSTFLTYSSAISLVSFTGESVDLFAGNTIIGPNEIAQSSNFNNLALLRCTGVFSDLTLRTINVSSGGSTDYLITGLIGPSGPQDNSIYHYRTIWHTNNRIYSCHSIWNSMEGRIIAVSPTGDLLYQYLINAGVGACSFVILGDFVYVWQDGIKGTHYNSAIIKLTLDLEFVCIVNCEGDMVYTDHYEKGMILATNGVDRIYNFYRANYGQGGITQWRVDPIAESTDVHDPVWEFTKQSDKF